MREILFRGKRIDNGEWTEGYFVKFYANGDNEPNYMIFTIYEDKKRSQPYSVIPETICRYTELTGKNDKKIYENDICKLVLPDGEVRYFKVSIKSVVRKVISHPDFDDITAKVEITGVVFEWNGYELFPCTDTYGVADYKMMEVVGNIFDNPEFVEGD